MGNDPSTAPDVPDEPAANDRLDSWKEIASYLKRDERTVRRWEKSEGLPVRRHVHLKKPTVYAYRQELDAWWNNRRPRLERQDQAISRIQWSWFAGTLLTVAVAGGVLWYQGLRSQESPDPEGVDSRVVIRQVFPNDDDSEGARDTCNWVSPDGRYLSCVDGQSGNLAVLEISTRRKRLLTNKGSWNAGEYAYESVFSRNGRHIAYGWHNKNNIFDLRVTDIDDSPPRILYRSEEVPHLDPVDWSKDGRFILAVLERTDGTKQIAMVSVADGTTEIVKELDGGFPGKMTFSADGRFILYAYPPEASSKRDIFLMTVDGSRETRLTRHAADDFFPVWTPDEEGVVFLSNRTGTTSSWYLRIENGVARGAPEILHRDHGNLHPIGVTSGGSLFYLFQTGTVDVYLATVDPETGAVLEPPRVAPRNYLGNNLFPDWSPDGGRLAFVSRRDPAVLSILDVDTGEERALSPAVNHPAVPRWSPDGRSILLKGSQEDRWGYFQTDAETGDVLGVLFEGLGGFPQWSLDGTTLYYSDHTTAGAARVLERDIASGHETEIYRAQAPSVLTRLSPPSPDGRFLAFALGKRTTASTALMILPLDGGEPRELLSVPKPDWLVAYDWTPDGRHVLFTRMGDLTVSKEVKLYRASVEDGETRLLLTVDTLRDVSMNPDGRRIAYTAGEPLLEMFVMENFLPGNGTQ